MLWTKCYRGWLLSARRWRIRIGDGELMACDTKGEQNGPLVRWCWDVMIYGSERWYRIKFEGSRDRVSKPETTYADNMPSNSDNWHKTPKRIFLFKNEQKIQRHLTTETPLPNVPSHRNPKPHNKATKATSLVTHTEWLNKTVSQLN